MLVAEKFPQSPCKLEGRLPIGCKVFDQKGGFLRGAITEVCGSSAGGSLLLAAVGEAAVRDGFFIGLIDAANSFEPSDWADEVLRRVLWMMCGGSAVPAIRAADILLRDGNLPVVILDLQMLPSAAVAHPLEHLASLSTPYRTDLHSIDGADAATSGRNRCAAWQSRQGSPWRPWISPSGAMGASRCADLRARGCACGGLSKIRVKHHVWLHFSTKIPSQAALRWHEVCGPAVVVDEATLKGIVLETKRRPPRESLQA